MNNTAQVIQHTIKLFNTTSGLSTRIGDIANVFVLPPICIVGIALNAACITVVAQKELNGELYSFIMFHSICDLIFLFINTFTCIIRGGIYCPYTYAFLSKVWELYVHLFTGNSFLLFGTGLDIVVSFNRVFSFSSTRPKLIEKFNRIDLRIKCLVLAVISIVANLPSYVITRNVFLIGYLQHFELVNLTSSGNNSIEEWILSSNEPLYQAQTNPLGKNEFMVGFLFVLTLFRGVIPLFVLFFMNIVIGYKFRSHLKQKAKIVFVATLKPSQATSEPSNTNLKQSSPSRSSAQRSQEQVTKMVLIMCTFFLVGNVPNSISPILFTLNVNSILYGNYVIFGNLMLLVSRGSYFFIYYHFNASFRGVFHKLVRQIFGLKVETVIVTGSTNSTCQ